MLLIEPLKTPEEHRIFIIRLTCSILMLFRIQSNANEFGSNSQYSSEHSVSSAINNEYIIGKRANKIGHHKTDRIKLSLALAYLPECSAWSMHFCLTIEQN